MDLLKISHCFFLVSRQILVAHFQGRWLMSRGGFGPFGEAFRLRFIFPLCSLHNFCVFPPNMLYSLVDWSQVKYSSTSSEDHQFVRGIPVYAISQVLEKIIIGGSGPALLINGVKRPMPLVRILEVELYPTLLSKARSFGLSDEWIQVSLLLFIYFLIISIYTSFRISKPFMHNHDFDADPSEEGSGQTTSSAC